MDKIVIKDMPVRYSSDISKLSEQDFNNRNHNFLKKISNNNVSRFEQNRISLLNTLYQLPTFAEFFNDPANTGKKFEVVIPKQILKKLESGKFALNRSSQSTDLFTTSIREVATGKIVKNVMLKEIADVSNVESLLPNLQNMAIQQALAEISGQLQSIERKIDQILTELHNDRVGKLQSGYALYLDALQISDNTLRDQSLLLAKAQLFEGRGQLIETGKQKFAEFSKSDGFWNSLFNELTSVNHLRNQNKLLADFAQSLFYIQRSTQIIAEINYEMVEQKSLLQSLSPYRDFMNEICTPAGLKALDDWDASTGWKDEIRGIRRALKAIPLQHEINTLDYHFEIKTDLIINQK